MRLRNDQGWNVLAPMNVVVIDDLNVEPGDWKFGLRRDNIMAMYQRIKLGQVWTQEEGCGGGEDGERVGFINVGGNSTEFSGLTPRK